MFEFSSINLVRMSVFCAALFAFKFFLFQNIFFMYKWKIEGGTPITVLLNSNNARMDPIFKNFPHYRVTDESRYCILHFILWDFQILDNSRKLIIQILSFQKHFLYIIFQSFSSLTSVIFSLDVILLGSNGLTTFQLFITAYIFYPPILISPTILQKQLKICFFYLENHRKNDRNNICFNPYTFNMSYKSFSYLTSLSRREPVNSSTPYLSTMKKSIFLTNLHHQSHK